MSEQPPVYTDRQGGEHKTTRYHWYHPQGGAVARLVICPVCNCGPCAPDCTEHAIPAPADVVRRPVVSAPLIGTGDPGALIRAAFAEAARLKQVEREEGLG